MQSNKREVNSKGRKYKEKSNREGILTCRGISSLSLSLRICRPFPPPPPPPSLSSLRLLVSLFFCNVFTDVIIQLIHPLIEFTEVRYPSRSLLEEMGILVYISLSHLTLRFCNSPQIQLYQDPWADVLLVLRWVSLKLSLENFSPSLSPSS